MTNDFALSRNILVATGKIAVEPKGPSLWRRLIDWWTLQRRYEKTLAELEKLDDSMLDDIGLTRGDLSQAAWDAVYQNHPHAG